MTTAQIHRIVYLNGLVRGINCIDHVGYPLHYRKDPDFGRLVGTDEYRYLENRKSASNMIRSIYNDVMTGKV